MEGKSCIAKAKTNISRRTTEPLFQQSLVFNENAEGRMLQVRPSLKFQTVLQVSDRLTSFKPFRPLRSFSAWSYKSSRSQISYRQHVTGKKILSFPHKHQTVSQPPYRSRFTHRTYVNPQSKLQITVWGDYGRIERKSFMGIAQIQMDNLNLGAPVIGWYKLFHSSSIMTAHKKEEDLPPEEPTKKSKAREKKAAAAAAAAAAGGEGHS